MATHPEYNRFTDASEVAAAFPDQIKGKTILITGVSPNGIGQSITEALAAYTPSQLILTGRSQTKVQTVIDQLVKTHPVVPCKYIELDLSSIASVRKAAQKLNDDVDIPVIDIVICNAGVMWIPEHQQSVDNIEMQFATNYVGHFLLINLIVAKLIAAAQQSPDGAVRVVNVSSAGSFFSPVRFSDLNFTKAQQELPEEERANLEAMKLYGMNTDGIYNPIIAYAQSKTAAVLFSLTLTNRLYKKYGIKSYALHPGGIQTELWRHTGDELLQQLVEGQKAVGLGFKTLEQGASTTLVAALDPNLSTPSSKGDYVYLDDCQLAQAAEWARDPEKAEELWKVSEELVGQQFSV